MRGLPRLSTIYRTTTPWLHRILATAIAALCSLIPGTAAGSTPLPPASTALVLYKCIPYNQAWETLQEIRVDLLAFRPEDVVRAEEIAEHLTEVGHRARHGDPSSALILTRIRSPEVMRARTDDGSPAPQILFLLGSDTAPDPDLLAEIAWVASEQEILVATDREELLASCASLGIVLSATQRPEVVIDLERTRAQGSRFRAGLVRFARPKEDVR